MEARDEIRSTIAANITALRSEKGLTQAELAEKLHYSDKAVSKWERAESLPDVTVLMQIAAYFGVPLQYLLEKEHRDVPEDDALFREKRRNHAIIIGMAVLLVWLVAYVIFLAMLPAEPSWEVRLLPFIYAVPVSMLVWLILNAIWFSIRKTFLIASLLMWTLLIAVFVHFLLFGKNIWLVLLLGIPGQIIILLSAGLNYKESRRLLLRRRAEKKNAGDKANGGQHLQEEA